MQFLTKDKDVATLSVLDLGMALNGDRKTIQLPAFQRDAVWDEKRIALLWDSLFRDFPIGSLLFAGATGVYKPLSLTRPAEGTNVAESTEFIIIDGQQRSNAIALGLRKWVSGDAARLWIDLGMPVSDGSLPDRFFVCSWREPWGIEATEKRLATDALQRDAVSFLGRKFLEIDDNVLGATWPVAATLPVPLAELIQLLQAGDRDGWRQLVPQAKQDAVVRQIALPDFDHHIAATLGNLAQALDNQILIYVIKKRGIEELGEVFRRLNTAGINISEEDLFFSGLKLDWPEAHDLVWEIFDGTGRFMRPTQIVHLAVRLVLNADNQDILQLTSQSFKMFIAGKREGKSYLDEVKDLMVRRAAEGESALGQLHAAVHKARRALAYDPQSPAGVHDPGLPAVLLARLNWRVWHTLAAWIHHNENVDAESRLEMLRYALLDHHFTESKSASLTREPFRIAFNTIGQFPGFAIYYALRQAGLLTTNLLTPAAYKETLTGSDKPRWDILLRERELVMWVQRRYLHEWFQHFDPTLARSTRDLPYDVDHILPQAHMNMRGRNRREHGGPSREFWDYRNVLLHGSGNIRYWPKDLNRSDGRKSLTDKYLLGPADKAIPDNSYLSQRFNLHTVGDVRDAAFLKPDNAENLEQWSIASPELASYDWRGERGIHRIKAFREATESRRQAIFERFYLDLGWEKWAQRETLSAQVRQYVVKKASEAIGDGKNEIAIAAGQVTRELYLPEHIALVCMVLDSDAFYIESGLLRVAREGSPVGEDAVWRLRVAG